MTKSTTLCSNVLYLSPSPASPCTTFSLRNLATSFACASDFWNSSLPVCRCLLFSKFLRTSMRAAERTVASPGWVVSFVVVVGLLFEG